LREVPNREELVSIRRMVIDSRPGFVALAQKISEKRWTYKNFYGIEDVRPEFFDRETQLLIWLLIELDNFLIITDSHSDRISRYIKFAPQDLTTFIAQYDTINRGNFCTRIMFDVDNLLSRIADKIHLKIIGSGFVPMIRAFSSTLGLNEEQFRILVAPALFRNASHNNGYHRRGEEFDLTIRSATFHIKKDQPVSGFTWVNMAILFEELYGVIERIIGHDKVKAEPFIPHDSLTYHDIT
jgi:hypothetical protein